MGLLDQFTDFLNTPAGMGLLSAAGAGLAGAKRGAPMNSIGRGLLGGVQGYTQAQDNANQQKFMDQRSKLYDAQIQEAQAQEEARKAARDRQLQQQNYLSSVGRVTSPVVGAQPNKADPRKMLALDFSPDQISTYMSADNLGKPKVARTIEGVDAQGNKVTRQFDEFGNEIGGGVQAYTAPVQVDLGGRVQFVQPRAGVNLTKTMTPGEIASNSVARANLGIAQQRLNLDKQGRPEFKDGQWVVPPKDMAPGEVRPVPPPTSSRDANDALALIQQARQILPSATGSYGGMAVDQAARVFGKATEGAKATAQLQAIEGALVAKMPKMSGPQSDKDAALYKQMAAVVGDPTVPVEQRQAALDVVEQIQQRYASGQGGASGNFGVPDIASAAAAELARRKGK